MNHQGPSYTCRHHLGHPRMDCTRLSSATPKLSSSAESLPSKAAHIWEKFPSFIQRGRDREDLGSVVQSLQRFGSCSTSIRISQPYLIFFDFFGIFVCIVLLLVVGLVTLISAVREAVKHERLSSARTSHWVVPIVHMMYLKCSLDSQKTHSNHTS